MRGSGRKLKPLISIFRFIIDVLLLPRFRWSFRVSVRNMFYYQQICRGKCLISWQINFKVSLNRAESYDIMYMCDAYQQTLSFDCYHDISVRAMHADRCWGARTRLSVSDMNYNAGVRATTCGNVLICEYFFRMPFGLVWMGAFIGCEPHQSQFFFFALSPHQNRCDSTEKKPEKAKPNKNAHRTESCHFTRNENTVFFHVPRLSPPPPSLALSLSLVLSPSLSHRLIQFAYAFHLVETYRAHFMMRVHYYYIYFARTPKHSSVPSPYHGVR